MERTLPKTVVVTGGNQGIGYYLVRQLLRQGNRVAVFDRETDKLTDFQKEYGKEYGDCFLACVCDVRDEEKIRECVRETFKRWQTIDIAVHNACQCEYLPFEQTSDDLFQKVLEVNLYGARHLAEAVLPYMKQQKSGRLIFTSSGVGVTGFDGISPYAVSKGAIESLAKCLELEYRKYGISVHLFHPPLTRTRSAAPLPVPAEFMAAPEKVGKGLARNIGFRNFVICHSRLQQFQMKLCYLWPLTMGRMMCRMTERAKRNL